MRKRIFRIIEASNGSGILSSLYDCLMIAVIIVSLVPLAFKSDNDVFLIIDNVAVGILIIDYLLRFITADYRYNNKSIRSFIKYPFSFFAIVDLISILPSLTALSSSFKLLRLLRMMRALRVLHVFKALRYSKNIRIIATVFKQQKAALTTVGALAIGYILISALVIFNVEPDSFESFFDAVYWATISLTAMGYGDIYPVSATGRTVAMVSAIFGIAVVALPAGIITAGYINEINGKNNNEPKQDRVDADKNNI
ncbi:MAG: ion transporter [Dehalococcoidia bacterium]|nr:ion transporter [Dehalococcoidia bacterium]